MSNVEDVGDGIGWDAPFGISFFVLSPRLGQTVHVEHTVHQPQQLEDVGIGLKVLWFTSELGRLRLLLL